MSYYARPMGDYRTYGYAGDPGFLSSLWKGIKKVAVPIIGGLIGGPIGAVVAGAAGRTPAVQVPRAGFPGVGMGFQLPAPPGWTFPPGMNGGAGAKGPSMPGWKPPGTQGQVYPPGQGGPCPAAGYHWAKDGSGRMVRNRRMNVANPRALRRSMRRVQGFEKLARRTISFTRRVKMKKRKTS